MQVKFTEIRLKRILSLGLLVCGVVLTGSRFFKILGHYEFHQNAIFAKAKVVRIENYYSNDYTDKSQKLFLEFTDDEGKLRETSVIILHQEDTEEQRLKLAKMGDYKVVHYFPSFLKPTYSTKDREEITDSTWLHNHRDEVSFTFPICLIVLGLGILIAFRWPCY